MRSRLIISCETGRIVEKRNMKWMDGDLGDNDYVHISIVVMVS